MSKLTIVLLISIGLISSCKNRNETLEKVSFICLRSNDTLYLKISNNSKDTIHVSQNLIGTYELDSDTIFLQVKDQTRFEKTTYYKYSRVFPFEFYTVKKIDGQIPDTSIAISSPKVLYNQFLVSPFAAIYPGGTYTCSLIFNVPARANIAQLIYYKQSFNNWLGKDSSSYQESDFLRFESVEATRAYTSILNRYYTMPE
jgi:hypothetical protein